MKVITFCLLFVLIYPYAEAAPAGECSNEMDENIIDFLADDTDCAVFYKCDSGEPVKYICPNGLYFNTELNVCDWPEAASCDINGNGGNEGGEEEPEDGEEEPEDGEEEPEDGEEEPEDEDSSSSSESDE